MCQCFWMRPLKNSISITSNLVSANGVCTSVTGHSTCEQTCFCFFCLFFFKLFHHCMVCISEKWLSWAFPHIHFPCVQLSYYQFENLNWVSNKKYTQTHTLRVNRWNEQTEDTKKKKRSRLRTAWGHVTKIKHLIIKMRKITWCCRSWMSKDGDAKPPRCEKHKHMEKPARCTHTKGDVRVVPFTIFITYISIAVIVFMTKNLDSWSSDHMGKWQTLHHTLIYIQISHCMFICHCILSVSRVYVLFFVWFWCYVYKCNIQQDWVGGKGYNFPFLYVRQQRQMATF